MSKIGQILPIHGYVVHFKGIGSIIDHQALIQLYQPIVGPKAVSLYLTLFYENQKQQYQQIPSTHHQLMTSIGLPLDEIYTARMYLEAIGLLRTFKKTNEQAGYIFHYILYPPFSANQFFKDTMLSLLLSHHIGENMFQKLYDKLYMADDVVEGSEITASFQEVFQDISLKPLVPVESQTKKENDILEKTKEELVDFVILANSLKQRMLPVQKLLTPSLKTLIEQLAALYRLTTHDFELAIHWALDEKQEIDVEELKEICHDLYIKNDHSQEEIKKEDENRQTIEISNDQFEKLNDQEKLIYMMERRSPKEVLEDFSNGSKVPDQDLKMIRDIMHKQGLPSPVMNMLIQYVLYRTDMKLNRSYIEKIAGQWSRLGIKTAREAMEVTIRENKKYQEWSKAYKKQTPPVKQEVVPEWFKKQKEQKSEPKQKQPTVSQDEFEKWQEEMRKFKKDRNQKQG
ncbi:DnaD domain protein [Bacillaceae bacterium S4-13-58]